MLAHLFLKYEFRETVWAAQLYSCTNTQPVVQFLYLQKMVVLHLISVGRIKRSMYSAISSDITTDEVIITPERIDHSNLHDCAFERYGQYIPNVLADPDLIFRDQKPHTAVLIKEVLHEGTNLQLVLRLHVPQDDPLYKNSVISFWSISSKRRENYERNKDIIYKKL